MLACFRYSLAGILAVAGFALSFASTDEKTTPRPNQVVLVAIKDVTPARVAGWKQEGFRGVIVLLEDANRVEAIRAAANAIREQTLTLYYWIEVGRSPTLARAHPEWMATLGMHNDWQQRYPAVRRLQKGEVARAWPWVPIRYREAFDAQQKRIARLLERLPQGYRGVLLNDLQGGPASCGCGNLQCRWATDYGVPSSTAKLDATEAAARFVKEIAKQLNDRELIPVWTTECEKEDLPLARLPAGSWSTGYCGDVPCLDYCRQRFNEQWAALQADRTGATALLLLHREFQRDRKEYGKPGNWLRAALSNLEKQGARAVPRSRLWLVVQGYDVPAGEEAQVRRAAADLGPGAVVVARTRIDQSYEPRIFNGKP